MAVSNLINIEFSDADLKKINIALQMLEETFDGKLVKDIATVYKETDAGIENFSAIPADDGTLLAMHIPAFTNISQWSNDEKARQQLNPIAARLKQIAQQVVNTNRAVLQRCWNSSAKY